MNRALLTLCILFAHPTFAADVARDGAPLDSGGPSLLEVGDGGAFPAGLRIGARARQWVFVDPRGFLTVDDPWPGAQAAPLGEVGRDVVAGFWADLQRGPCAGGQGPGRIVWAPTPRGVRVSWLDMPLAGCPTGARATFSVEVTTDDVGRPARVELRYEALPDGEGAEPRAGVVLGAGVMELLADGRDAALRGRAKRLLEYGSERAEVPGVGPVGPVIPGVWVIELGPDGQIAGDEDLDGVRSADNCPWADAPNPWQWNADGDLFGDVCDSDADDDDILDHEGDNCPLTANADQADRDGDGLGDACDDGDGDRLVDAIDRCPGRADPAALDLDGDGIPDACDPDVDGDGRVRVAPGLFSRLPGPDRCPYLPVDSWRAVVHSDADGDGLGDGCDLQPRRACKGFACLAELDSDGDGVADWRDTCPTAPDPAQLDGDGDGIGDPCDPDRDADGIPDIYEERGLLCDPLVCGRR